MRLGRNQRADNLTGLRSHLESSALPTLGAWRLMLSD
jgi:hypothetical protein